MLMLNFPTPAECSKLISVQRLRRQNLERLYQRRATVDVLIRCLEEYERSQQTSDEQCVELLRA